MDCLSSGTWLMAGRYENFPRFKRADAIVVLKVGQSRYRRNKPKAMIVALVRQYVVYVKRPHIVPILVRQRLNGRGTESY